jgi:hypothetical protein
MSNHRENQNDAEELTGIFAAFVAVLAAAVLLFCLYGIIIHIIDYIL